LMVKLDFEDSFPCETSARAAFRKSCQRFF
jgi:hypothetical protein